MISFYFGGYLDESRKKKNREYKKKNKKAISDWGRIYYLKNKDRILKTVHKYRTKNKTLISLKEAERRLKDPERFGKNKLKHLSWSEKNRERLNEWQRKWYQHNKEKRRAHVVLSRAIGSGKIMRPKECSECKKECKPDGHHVDYSKPLDVVWICRACHSRKSPRTVVR